VSQRSRSFLSSLSALSVLLFVATTTLSAQRPQTREGFWANLGLGWATLGCDDCDDRIEGAGAALALGGTLSPKWQLGGAVNNWYKSEDNTTLTVTLVSVVAKFYPAERAGFYLMGGLGVASIDAQIGSDDLNVSGRETGTGILLGLGYDIRIGRNVSLTPFWNGVATKYDGGGDLNFGQLGLGITIH